MITYPLSPRTMTLSKVLFLCELEISMFEIQNSKALNRSRYNKFFIFLQYQAMNGEVIEKKKGEKMVVEKRESRVGGCY